MSDRKNRLIGEAIQFNPPEKIAKGALVKKIPMGQLSEFQRKINGFEFSTYNSGPKFRNGDVLVAKITPCIENGKTAQCDILDEGEVAFGSSEFIVLRETKYSVSDYIYYLAVSPTFRKRAISCMEGTSGRRRVNENTLKHFEIPFPDIDEQQRIAKILRSLDAKIELNNKINQELESMAQTIYDYWFVQFDFPNHEGKPYKASGGKMVYNEEVKREMPEGWKVRCLGDIANITMGQSPAGTSYNDTFDGVMFFQGSTDFGWRFPSVRQYTTEPSRMAKAGDILLSVRAPVGTINIADNNCCIGRGLASLNSKYGYNSFLYYILVYFKKIFEYRNTTGTTFGSINKDDLFSLILIYPKDDLLLLFNNSVSKYNLEIMNNHKQNQELTSLRDWLLPMLMNGQISVADAEARISETME